MFSTLQKSQREIMDPHNPTIPVKVHKTVQLKSETQFQAFCREIKEFFYPPVPEEIQEFRTALKFAIKSGCLHDNPWMMRYEKHV